MKIKYFNLLYVLTLLLVFLSCRKALNNVKDYYPKIKTTSATVQGNGEVELKGIIESNGDSPIEFVGFCYDTLPEPTMLKNQVIAKVDGKNFSFLYGDIFDPEKTYYFRSWGTNNNGYSYGNTISLTNIKASPVIPTCSLASNFYNQGSGNQSTTFFSVTNVANSITWNIDAYSWTSGNLFFKFGSKPRTKVYKVVTYNPGLNEVNVIFNSGFISGMLENNNSVYVNELSSGKYSLTICQGSWKINSSSTSFFYMNANLVSPS